MITCAEAVKQLWDYLDGSSSRSRSGSDRRAPELLPPLLWRGGVRRGAARFLAREAAEEIPDEVRARLMATLDELSER